MWRKYLGPNRRYLFKKFKLDFEKFGEGFRQEVATSLLREKRKLNFHDKAFLEYLEFYLEQLPNDPNTGKSASRYINGHYFWDAPIWRLGNITKVDISEEVADYQRIAKDLKQYFHNPSKDIFDILFTNLAENDEEWNSALKRNVTGMLYRLVFKSETDRTMFLEDMRTIVLNTKVLSQVTIANKLVRFSNIGWSESYIVHYLSDKA